MRLEEQAKEYQRRIDPKIYDQAYSDPGCLIENAEIKRIFQDRVQPGQVMRLADLGCGTGFGYDVCGQPLNYTGVDVSWGSVSIARGKFPNAEFRRQWAEDYISRQKKLFCVTSFFSLNYMVPDIIRMVAERLVRGGAFFAVHYNRPYLTSNSHWYHDLKEFFLHKHAKRQQQIKAVFDSYNAETFNLLDEPYYFVTILRGEQLGK